ncbi:glycoside hydrolase family 75 protein [Streptomyces sp. NPDC002701]|uniref:glycoside hydrolase family 75 protein n=1 Tax=Streptomyces sp. NPDC002701 TaxID=3364661 RepID=UPI003674F681
MRVRNLTLAAACGAALLAAAALPADAESVRIVRARDSAVTAAALLAKVASCPQVSHGLYRTDAGRAAEIPVCAGKGAVFWKADMDIDCDGQVTPRCNKRTDPWFQDRTAFQQSDGRPLNSETLPHVVVPSPSSLWNYADAGVEGGSVAAVIHGDRVQYAVVGDTGPADLIGEASYATARALGIDPDPATGGTGSGVTYIVFTPSRVTPIESRDAAVSLGEELARRFVGED